MLRFFFLFSVLFSFSYSNAQNTEIIVKGLLLDSADNTPLAGATMRLINPRDTSVIFTSICKPDGSFQFSVNNTGMHILLATFVGYKPLQKRIFVHPEQSETLVGTLFMALDARLLDGVRAEGTRIRVEQKGDTVELNAAAYQTNPDADVKDLVTKMPGFTLENGEVKVQGEKVRKVTVDGKEYFGEDATAAMRNLPAEIVSKIQVFDEQSEQSRFTGFDDGNALKTINIITKTGMNQGQFGKIYGGYGTDNRYLTGLNVNFFGKERKIAVLGLANNVNIQNFAAEDLAGALGSSATGRMGGMGGRPMGNWGGGNQDFTVAQQNGITTANGLGINYTDKWSPKISVSSSYFFNRSNNQQNTSLSRDFFLQNEANQLYLEDAKENKINQNHRFNARLEWNPDSIHSFVYRPRISLQTARSNGVYIVRNSIPLANILLNENTNIFKNNTSAYDINNELLYRRKLGKIGRTFSVSTKTNHSSNSRDANMLANNLFFGQQNIEETIDQLSKDYNTGQSYSADFSFTENMGKKGQLMITYNPSYSLSTSDRKVNFYDTLNSVYSILDSTLSNEFENKVYTQRGGVNYTHKFNERLTLTSGLTYQNAQLEGNQAFPFNREQRYAFPAILPNARLNYKFKNESNLMFMYRSFTRLPGISQLQPLVDNSNPLLLRSGNPDLNQEQRHFAFVRFGKANKDKGRSLMVFISGTLIQDFISNANWIARTDGFEIGDGIVLNRGAQFTRPVNLAGYRNIRNFITYGLPVKKIKSNLNFNVGYNLSSTPGLINDQKNTTTNHNFNAGLVVASNISKKLDFTLSYTANYSDVSYSFNPQQDNAFFFQNGSAKINWMPWKGWVIQSETYYSGYSGLADGFNRDIVLWNGGIGYKFLKDKRGEFRITAYDLLNRNNSISRMVTENYIQDSEVMVLQRFFLLNFTYQIRHYKRKIKPVGGIEF